MEKPRVIIVGAGFGGLQVAKRLANKPVEVLVLDRCNHHLFQPLLYQVATAGLSPANIAQPIRGVLRGAGNIEVQLAQVTRIDPVRRRVVAADAAYDFDYLVLATGARHSYFGHPEWEQFAPGLKNLDDAVDIRRRILTAFELAEKAADAREREEAMTFVVVGAGPTGVEMAGAIAELARHSLVRDFRNIRPDSARILLVDAAPRVLPMLDEELSRKAEAQLERLGVQVRCNLMVKNVTATHLEFEEETIAARTIIWAAGNAASPLGKELGVERDKAGRVMVNEDLTIAGHPEIYVIGDLANFSHQTGEPLPGISPVAIQQGRQVARNLLATIAGRPREPFRYSDKGAMATIGRHAAVADLHFVRLSGFVAWLAWLFVHLIFLIGFRNRVFVLIQWVWNYMTFGRGARLITGYGAAPPPMPHGKKDEDRGSGDENP